MRLCTVSKLVHYTALLGESQFFFPPSFVYNMKKAIIKYDKNPYLQSRNSMKNCTKASSCVTKRSILFLSNHGQKNAHKNLIVPPHQMFKCFFFSFSSFFLFWSNLKRLMINNDMKCFSHSLSLTQSLQLLLYKKSCTAKGRKKKKN